MEGQSGMGFSVAAISGVSIKPVHFCASAIRRIGAMARLSDKQKEAKRFFRSAGWDGLEDGKYLDDVHQFLSQANALGKDCRWRASVWLAENASSGGEKQLSRVVHPNNI